jgi:hypothetical protein
VRKFRSGDFAAWIEVRRKSIKSAGIFKTCLCFCLQQNLKRFACARLLCVPSIIKALCVTKTE